MNRDAVWDELKPRLREGGQCDVPPMAGTVTVG
jgi:hypothetical protein